MKTMHLLKALPVVHGGAPEDPNLSVAGEEDPGAALDLPGSRRASQPLAQFEAGRAPLNPADQEPP